MYRLEATAEFERTYGRMPSDVQEKIDEQVQRLCVDPRHPSLRTHKRRGEIDVWQARITRSYRLLFRMEGETITLLRVMAHEK